MATKKPAATHPVALQPEAPVPAVVQEQIDFSADAGAGMEGATPDAFAVPFLLALQKGSPQVDDASPTRIEDAKAGQLFDSITERRWDGKTGVRIIPCAFRRVFLRWGPRTGEGAGFKGEIDVDTMAQMRARGEVVEYDGRLYAPLADGTVNEKRCDRFADTRNHYVLILDPETGAFSQALMSLASTQIKKSRALLSMLHETKWRNAAGTLYTPPTFAQIVCVTTVPEQNDKGTWHGYKFALDGRVEDRVLYAAGKAFNELVVRGGTTARYDDAAATTAPAAGEERF